jgi:hypothetical protein
VVVKNKVTGEEELDEHPGEKGYYNGMYDAFRYLLKTKGERLNVAMLEDTNRLALTGAGHSATRTGITGAAEVTRAFGLTSETATKAGLSFILKNYFLTHSDSSTPSSPPSQTVCQITKQSGFFPVVLKKFTEDIIPDLIDKILKNPGIYSAGPHDKHSADDIRLLETQFIERFYRSVDKFKKPVAPEHQDAFLLELAKLLQVLSIVHGFTDGNTRTIVMGAGNKLLLDFGFPPAMYEDPNVFDGHSPEELVTIIKDAIHNTEKHFTPIDG